VAEDELAVAYDPDTGSALSDALVNMRYAFSRAVAENVIDRDTETLIEVDAIKTRASIRRWPG
jgi:hypothetical protein